MFYIAFKLFSTLFFTIPNFYKDRNFSSALSLMAFQFASKPDSALSDKQINIMYLDLYNKCIRMEHLASWWKLT